MSDNATTAPADRLMIRLDKVTKHYPNLSAPAVAELSLGIRGGEIVVLLGPSGCGKTTTLRLINRLIEPSSGRVLLDGEDVTRVHADRLRQRIGYVIQQVGLFPHMTIAANVGLLPRTLGWDKQRIRERVDELLSLVGLEPAQYRGRYPKHLSGGQQQRVGVARALVADPPVMLMDEPFGAVDPITRERLQDEFLSLQARIRKTIVLVTHDVAEAIKLGDRIAVFADQARLAQYDTPATILAEPADSFVASFMGSGAAVRRLRLETVGDAPLEPVAVVRAGTTEADVRAPTTPGRAVLVDEAGKVLDWSGRGGLPARGEIAVLRMEETVYDALDAMLRARDDAAVVVDGEGRPVGALSWTSVVHAGLAEPEHDPVRAEQAELPGGAR